MMNMSDKVHGLKDRKKSEETRRKTRKTNKNKAYSDLSKKELTPWMKRKRNTEEVKRKLTKYFNRPEEREKLSINRLKQKFSIKDTKPEKILQKICKDAKIQFVKQKSFKLDNYEWHHTIRSEVDVFVEPNICLFVDGDWWHTNPKEYMKNGRRRTGIKPDTTIVSSARRGIKKVAKDIIEKDDGITRDLESQGYIVLRFWESDLIYDTETCCQRIIDAVNKSQS